VEYAIWNRVIKEFFSETMTNDQSEGFYFRNKENPARCMVEIKTLSDDKLITFLGEKDIPT
jgi:hypothetical protein